MKISNVILAVAVTVFMTGCAGPIECLKGALGMSTKVLEDGRKDAMVKVFDYDLNTCYEKTEKTLKTMPKTFIYAKNKQMIAVYYIDPNTNPVGVFFKEVDAKRTQVEITSPSPTAKEWVSKNVFSESVLPATPAAKTFKGGSSKPDKAR